MEPQKNLLEDLVVEPPLRRSLLPWWMKFFVWVFMIFGVVVPLSLTFGLLRMQFQISLYGFETTNPLSIVGILLTLLFLLKAIVAYGLWTGKTWAVDLGLADGVLGIAVCVFGMIYSMTQNRGMGFRLEILFLLLYIVFLSRLRHQWKISR